VTRRLRLAVFASHPIQYQAPVWRRLAKHADVDLLVHYFSDRSITGGGDPDFGVPVAWDQPLLEGYPHVFLSRNANIDRPLQVTVPRLATYLRETKFDAAFLNGYSYAFELQIRRLAPQLDLPLILRPELSAIRAGGPLRRITRSLFRRWFYSGVRAFAVIGRQARRSLLDSGVPAQKMFFSPYAVDSDLFQRAGDSFDRPACRQFLGIPADRFVLLFSGKLIPRKNLSLVLRALEQAPARERVTFIVLGDGPDRSVIEQEGRRLLGRNFLLAGFQNQGQLAPYFKAADAFVLPSVYETWGLVVNEAMHFGLPVIVSDRVGCAADLVEDRETGLLFRSNDASDLRGALQKLMESDGLLRKFSANARRVIGEYTPDNSAKGILDALGYACKATTPKARSAVCHC
jgi:glycosyltransferase involved in cell wall biosynthesis